MSQICHKIHQLFSSLPEYHFPLDLKKIPQNGIYVLFEKGELAHQGNRIVRVGTHRENDKLPSRLRDHFNRENKDGSVFRKNIGRAILNKDSDPFLIKWEMNLSKRETRKKYGPLVDPQKRQETEKRISEYLRQNFYFVVILVEQKEKRLLLESKIISTVSLCNECRPSETWLGLHSPKEKIRSSGLWLVNELYKQPLTEKDYGELEVITTSHL